jgi:hypothetical protein
VGVSLPASPSIRFIGWARLPTPVAAKPGPMPTHERLGPDDREDLQDPRNPAVQLDKEPAIIIRKPDATMEPAPQDNQLMSKHRVFSLKPQLRLEWRGQDGQSETEQPDHSVSLDVMSVSRARRFPWWAGARGWSPHRRNPVRKLNDRSRPELGGPPCVCKIGLGLLG